MEFTCKPVLLYEDIHQTNCFDLDYLGDFCTVCQTIEDLLYYLLYSNCKIEKIVIGDGFNSEVLIQCMEDFIYDLPSISSEELQQIQNMIDIYAPFGLIEYLKIARKKQNKSIPTFYILTTGNYYPVKNNETEDKLIEMCKKYDVEIFFKSRGYYDTVSIKILLNKIMGG